MALTYLLGKLDIKDNNMSSGVTLIQSILDDTTRFIYVKISGIGIMFLCH